MARWLDRTRAARLLDGLGSYAKVVSRLADLGERDLDFEDFPELAELETDALLVKAGMPILADEPFVPDSAKRADVLASLDGVDVWVEVEGWDVDSEAQLLGRLASQVQEALEERGYPPVSVSVASFVPRDIVLDAIATDYPDPAAVAPDSQYETAQIRITFHERGDVGVTGSSTATAVASGRLFRELNPDAYVYVPDGASLSEQAREIVRRGFTQVATAPMDAAAVVVVRPAGAFEIAAHAVEMAVAGESYQTLVLKDGSVVGHGLERPLDPPTAVAAESGFIPTGLFNDVRYEGLAAVVVIGVLGSGQGAVAVFRNPNNRSPIPTGFDHAVSQASDVLDA